MESQGKSWTKVWVALFPRDAGRAVAGAVEELAGFVGAADVEYGTVPRQWARALRA